MAALRLPWSSIGVEVHIATWPLYSQPRGSQGTGICVNHINIACIRRVQSYWWGNPLKKRSSRVKAADLVKLCTDFVFVCWSYVCLPCKVHSSIPSSVSSETEPNDMGSPSYGSVLENKFHLLNQPCNLTSYHSCVGCCPGISWGSSTSSPINLYNVTLISLNKKVNLIFFLFKQAFLCSCFLQHLAFRALSYKDFVNLLWQEKFSLSTHWSKGSGMFP